MRMHKRFFSLCITVILLLGMLVVPAAAAEPQIQWRGTFNHTDNNTVVNVPLPSDPDLVEQVWSSEVGNNTIVIVDDAIYTYNGINPELWSSYEDGGTFYKLDADTGEVLQSVSCDYGTTFYYSYSIYANDMIYVGCPTAIMAFDPQTCSMVWDTPVTERYYPTLQYVNGCVVSNGTVLNADTGAHIASIVTPNWGAGWSNGVEIGGKFYVADATESLYEIDTTTWNITNTWNSGLSAAACCPGVMYSNGRLYWGGVSGNVHSMQVTEAGMNASSAKTVDAGIKCYGAPVAHNGRIYVAGMTTNASDANVGRIAVSVHQAESLSVIYQTGNQISGKIQGTPILAVTDAGTVHIYVQGYTKPGIVYYLEDSDSKTSGELVALVTPEQNNYAWGQLACDQDGALYVTNDNGYLMKYQTKRQTPPSTQNPLVGGDVDLDGEITMRDAIQLARYLADWDVSVDKEQADANGDSEINMMDVVLLRRYMAGWYS